MKKVILAIGFCTASICIAQQQPLFASEGFLPLNSNPASYGSWNTFSVNTVGQLNAFGDFTVSRAMLANVEAKLIVGGKSSYETGIPFGAGLSYVAENNGFSTYQSFKVPINYAIKLGHSRLAIGVAPGFTRRKFDSFFVGADTRFDMDAGLFWYTKKYYAGYSISHLINPGYDEISFQDVMQHNLQLGAKFKIGQHYLFAMASTNYAGGFWNSDLRCYFQFKEDVFSIGAGYRISNSFMLAATGRIGKFKLGYNVTFNPISGFDWHSHEIRLSFIVPYKMAD